MAKDTSLTVSLFGRDISMGKALNGVGNSAKSATKTIDNMARRATIVFGAITAAGVLAAKNAAEDAKQQRILALTLENTSKATKAQTAAVEDYITKTSLAIGIADDELRPAFARLNLSTNKITESQKLLNLALDIHAARPMKSLDSIVNALGKAYDGNGQALGRLGLGIDANVLKSKNFNKIYDALRKTFKGFAEQEANTTDAKMRRLKIATDELRESFGYALLPSMEKLIGVFTNLLPWVEKHKDLVGKLTIGILAFSGAIIAINTAIKVYTAVTKAAAAAQLLWNAAFVASPVGWIVLALAAIAAGLKYAYDHSKKFREGWDSDWQGIKDMISNVANFITVTIPHAFNVTWTAIKNWFTNMKNAFLLVTGYIVAPFKEAFNLVAKLWNSTLGKIKFSVPDWVPMLGGKGWAMPNIPMLAEGGIVNKPTLAMIGEAGPEAVVPLSGNRGFGGGMNVTINVQGSLITQKELIAQVRTELAQLLRRQGAPISALGL